MTDRRLDPDRRARIEAETRRKYSGAFYKPDTIMRHRDDQGVCDYFGMLNRFKIGLVRRHIAEGARVLDLCCATAEHLFAVRDDIGAGVGLDFSLPFVGQAARRARDEGAGHIGFLCGNARRLPFPAESFDMVFAFSSLYNIPRAEEAVAEARRVLRPGGVAILDFGNSASLNAIVMAAHEETAEPCLLSIAAMRRVIRQAPMAIEERHAFQILPMWGDRPRWLRPLLHPFWNRLMERTVGGRMLDQRLCALPGLGRLAFRHIFVCRREGDGS